MMDTQQYIYVDWLLVYIYEHIFIGDIVSSTKYVMTIIDFMKLVYLYFVIEVVCISSFGMFAMMVVGAYVTSA